MSARELLAQSAAVAATLERCGSLSDGELVDALRAVGELRRIVDASGAALAADVSRRSAAGAPFEINRRWGERSPATLVAATARLEPAEAVAWCEVGDAVTARVTLSGELLEPGHLRLSATLGRGEISVTAAHRILRGLRDAARSGASAEQLRAFESTLVNYAPDLCPRELRRLIRRMLDLVDPDGAEPREDLLRSRSGVQIVQQRDGLTRLTALMHPEAAGFVLTALDARTAPRRQPVFEPGAEVGHDPGADPALEDHRTLAQRRLEALVGIARDSLAHDPGQVAGAPVTVMVTMTLDALRSGLGTATICGIDEPVSAATARRLASDAALIPAVLGAESELLDQGRESRLATPAQRRALARRDGGCAWSDCTAPPAWTEVAHIRAWAQGGRTDLENLVLLCPFHHRRLDHDDWQLHWRGRTLWLTPPAHVDPTRTPRRAGRPRLAA